jgi:hypothetical protein
MSSSKRKKEKRVTIGKLIFLTLITTIIISIITLSKYRTTVTGSDNTKIAVPFIYLNTSEILEIKMNPIENKKEYEFSVSNNESGVDSDVSMEYTIQIQTMNNLPLDFELYTYDNNIMGTENLFEKNGAITKNKIKMDLNENQEITHSYKLIIKWRENNTSYKFSQVEDYIKIVVDSNQID